MPPPPRRVRARSCRGVSLAPPLIVADSLAPPPTTNATARPTPLKPTLSHTLSPLNAGAHTRTTTLEYHPSFQSPPAAPAVWSSRIYIRHVKRGAFVDDHKSLHDGCSLQILAIYIYIYYVYNGYGIREHTYQLVDNNHCFKFIYIYIMYRGKINSMMYSFGECSVCVFGWKNEKNKRSA